MRRPLIAVAAIALAFALTGCASGDQTPAEPAESTEQNDAGDEQNDAAGSDEVTLGTATLGEQTYEFTEVILCERFEDDVVQFDLEIIALGKADSGGFVQLDAYQQQGSSDISWSGPEGTFGSDDGAAVTVSGDRVTGSGTLREAGDDTNALEMTFDLALPSDTTECR